MEKVKQIAVAVARAEGNLKRAKHDKDAAEVEKCIGILWHMRRQGGQLFAQLSGGIRRPHPVGLEERKIWRRMAVGLESEFEKRLQRYTKKALSTFGVKNVPKAARPPMPKKATKLIVPILDRVKTKVTEWKTDADGTLTREAEGIPAEAA